MEFEKDCTTNGVQGFRGPGMEKNCGELTLGRWKPYLFFLAGEHIKTFNLLDVLLDHSGLFNIT